MSAGSRSLKSLNMFCKMKKEFSTSWKASVQPRKQRKFRFNASFHVRHKFLSANLAKLLREKYGKRSMPIRKGDEVLVMRGSFRKKKAKVSSVNLKSSKVVLEGIQRAKKDGTKVNVKFYPHNLQIQSLNLDDKNRLKVLSRKSQSSPVKAEIKEAKK